MTVVEARLETGPRFTRIDAAALPAGVYLGRLRIAGTDELLPLVLTR